MLPGSNDQKGCKHASKRLQTCIKKAANMRQKGCKEAAEWPGGGGYSLYSDDRDDPRIF